MGSIGREHTQRKATADEMAQYTDIQSQLSQQAFNGYDANNPNHRLLVIAFDGTSSDRQEKDVIHTNPDILEQLVLTNDRVSSMYVHGVGTRSSTPIHSVYEMATGVGSEARAKQAYREFVTEVHEWRDANPNAEPHLITTGFSRGVGSQRHFANLVEDHGVPNKECTAFLIEPGQVKQDLLFMYDGVVTGQEAVLDLPIPQSVGVSIHLVAQEEDRAAFDLASSIDPLRPETPGRHEFMVPGFHVDSGGDVSYGGLSARTLEIGIETLTRSGVPLEELPPRFAAQDELTSITEPNRIVPLNWKFGERETDHFSDSSPGPNPEHDAMLDQGCSLSRS